MKIIRFDRLRYKNTDCNVSTILNILEAMMMQTESVCGRDKRACPRVNLFIFAKLISFAFASFHSRPMFDLSFPGLYLYPWTNTIDEARNGKKILINKNLITLFVERPAFQNKTPLTLTARLSLALGPGLVKSQQELTVNHMKEMRSSIDDNWEHIQLKWMKTFTLVCF